MNGISGILTNALQVLETASPLLDIEAYLSYVQNLIKDIDPDTEALMNDKTKESYIAFLRAKLMAMAEQQGIDPSILQPIKEEEKI